MMGSRNSGMSTDQSAQSVRRAAMYVRMSTDHQKYSTENQADTIREYAAKRGMEIVRRYADEGKSGLKIDGRDALKQLIADVQSGAADFQVILVLDVMGEAARRGGSSMVVGMAANPFTAHQAGGQNSSRPGVPSGYVRHLSAILFA